jgi:heme-degrading monooxygenase HmoA
MDRFALTPEPPYYAVVFTSALRGPNAEYSKMAKAMAELAGEQPGFLGFESVRDAESLGITVSYWKDLNSISKWKAQTEHRIAQDRGIAEWYSHYEVRVSKVVRDYSFTADAQNPLTDK